MSLVPAICPCCSANIEIPSGQDRCFCSYCGTQILTEAAVAFAKVRVEGMVQTKPADFVIKAGTLIEYHGESRDVVIPEGVVAVGARCFAGCNALRSVIIPEGVTSIGFSAFIGCGSLESVSLPSTLVAIGSEAFYDCKSLESVRLPSKLTSIGDSAFWGCESLEAVSVPKSVSSVGSSVFAYCNSLKKVEGYKRCMSKCFTKTPVEAKVKRIEWRASGLCQHCGGKFEGLFKNKCSLCGEKKDY